MRESVDSYFLNALGDTTVVFNQFDCRTFAAFVLASIVYKFEQGQSNALKGQLLSVCLEQIDDPNPILRKWFAICLGNLWQNYEDARWAGARDLAHDKLNTLLKDPVPEVRAATVYALGTFISSSSARTTQANDLDRQVAIMMLESVSNDMSPLVRMELIAALQWIVKLFEKSFVEVFMREDPHYLGGNYLDVQTRDGSWKRSGSKMKTVLSERNLQDRYLMGLGITGSTNIMSTSIYSKLWHGIVNLSRDPFPDVALMGSKVTDYIRQMAPELAPTIALIPLGREVICNDRLSTSGGSNSLPPSPNTRNINQFMSNSHTGSTVRLNSESGVRPSSESSGGTNPVAVAIVKPAVNKLQIPIVKTNFVDWEISSMARPLKYLANVKGRKDDQFAQETMERKKRFSRNERIRKEADGQQRLAVFHNLKNQSFIGKTSMTPSIVKLHPYEQQIVVAYLDRIMLNDWGLNYATSLSPMQLSSSTISHHSATIQTTTNSGKKLSVASPSPSSLRVSSIQFVNAHDRGLILAGYDDGSVRIWKNGVNNQSNKPPTANGNLVTAFQALEDQPSRSSRIFGLQTAWHQSTQTIFVGGESKIIRLWDAERELKIQDIITGSDNAVSHISCAPNALFAVGFGDGCIQIYDRRSPPSESKIMSYREHCQSLLTICLRNDCESLVSGW